MTREVMLGEILEAVGVGLEADLAGMVGGGLRS